MTGHPPWPTALSLEPSVKSPHHTAAAPLVGLSRRGVAVPKKEVSPPAQERTVEPGPGLDFGIEDVKEGKKKEKEKEMTEIPSLRF